MATDIWVATSDGIFRNGEVELEGRSIAALENRAQTWWVVVDDHELWRRDKDAAWTQAGTYGPHRLTCVLPLGDRVLAGTSEAHLVELADGELKHVESFDEVSGRDDWYTPWGGPPDVRSIAASESGSIFVNVHVGGIVRSDDGGHSWQPTIDIHSDVHEVATVDGERVLAATAWGLASSDDRGATWQFEDSNLHASYARAVAVTNGVVLLTASTGPRGGRAALYRRPLDGSGSFQKCEGGLPEWFGENINTACVATFGSQVAFGTHDGRVYLSDDSGISWSQVAKDLGEVRAVRLAG